MRVSVIARDKATAEVLQDCDQQVFAVGEVKIYVRLDLFSHGFLVVLAFLVGFIIFAALIARLPLIVQALDYGF